MAAYNTQLISHSPSHSPSQPIRGADLSSDPGGTHNNDAVVFPTWCVCIKFVRAGTSRFSISIISRLKTPLMNPHVILQPMSQSVQDE